MYKKITGMIFCAAALSACDPQAMQLPADWRMQGDEARPVSPEKLLNISTEAVNMNLLTPAHLQLLKSTVAQDPPTRAELNCSLTDPLCLEARQALDTSGVAVKMGQGSSAVLIYERMAVEDCAQPGFEGNPLGCAVASNMALQAGDKKQYTAPNLMDLPDAEKAVNSFERGYIAPPASAPLPPPTLLLQSPAR